MADLLRSKTISISSRLREALPPDPVRVAVARSSPIFSAKDGTAVPAEWPLRLPGPLPKPDESLPVLMPPLPTP